MRIIRRAVFSAFVLTSSALSAAERPNILFLLADDQRADTISALGNPRIKTPGLDALVKAGTTFTRATCSYPICVVSRAEILTGRHGWQNGIDGLAGRKFVDGVSFWAQTLKEAGYSTRYVGKWHSPGRPNQAGYEIANGLFCGGGGAFWREGQTDWKGSPITGYRGWIFQSMDGRKKYPEHGIGLTAEISSHFADAAIELLQQETNQPWFLHVNFTAPHDPLIMPPGYEGRYSANDMMPPHNFLPEHPFDHGNLKGRDESLMAWPRTPEAVRDVLRVYYSVIDDLDRQVGRILRALETSGQANNTIVIYTSDHGMAVGSHGLRGKQNMYEHTINVPLIIRGPGIPANRRTEAQVYLRQLYPTTCEFVGVETPRSVTAHSFAGVLKGGAPTEATDAIYGYFTDTQRMVRSENWKLIRYPRADRWQLFDLSTDPDEQNNLAEKLEQQVQFERLSNQLNAWRRRMNDPVISQ